MNIENIKALAEIFKENQLTSLEICEGETKIKLKKDNPTSVSIPVQKSQEIITNQVVIEEKAVDFNNVKEVKSPIVGVFYAASAPDAEPFAVIGNHVKKGDVVCIVEAMKLMNEIVSDCDGEIVDICVKNGDIVEFGQVLFKIF